MRQHPGVGDRRDRVDFDVVVGALSGEHPGQADPPGLRRTVVTHPFGAKESRSRAGVEDSPVALLAHDLPRGPRHVERTLEMYIYQRVEPIGGDVFERRVADDPGVVDHDVDTPPGLHGGVDNRLSAFGTGTAV